MKRESRHHLNASETKALKPSPLQRTKSQDSAGRGILLRRSRSMISVKDQSACPPDARSRESSSHQSRSMTPSRLLKGGRTMNESIQFMDLVAEQQLKEIRARRNQFMIDRSSKGGSTTKAGNRDQSKQRKHDGSRRAGLGLGRQNDTEGIVHKDRQPSSSRPRQDRWAADAPRQENVTTIGQGRNHGRNVARDTSRLRPTMSRPSTPREPRQSERRDYEGQGSYSGSGAGRGEEASVRGSGRHSSMPRHGRRDLDLQDQESFEDYSTGQRRNHVRDGGPDMSRSRQITSRSTTPTREPQQQRRDGEDSRDHSRDKMRSGSRGRGFVDRLSSFIGSFDSSGRQEQHATKREAKVSERLKRDMIDFDSLMTAIGNDPKNSLGAEFAVVELGDEGSAVQTHAILMNRDDIEDQLRARGSSNLHKRQPTPTRRW